jgi:ABC-2 type transport system ATP-binding protein
MPPADAVHLEGLTKAFGGRRRGLDGIDLVVPPGVVLGYLGPNGAGKSTTIRILMGLARATAGVATVLGLDAWADRDQLAHRVGYLPGDFAADPDLTADQYLRFMAELRGPAADLPEGGAVDALARRLGLDLSARIGALSHGNRQKVGLVRAFLGQPELLVLDEPTTGLDPAQRGRLRDVLGRAGESATVLISTHQTEDVAALCERVVVLDGGRVLFDGTVLELVAQADGRVWMADQRHPAARHAWRTGTGRVRNVGDPPPDAELIEPALEDAYLLLVGEAAEAEGLEAVS